MRNWNGAGAYRICPLCEARNKAGHTQCAKCRTSLGSAAVIAAAPGEARAGGDPLMRMLLIGGLLAAIAAGLVVRSILNASLESPVLAEEEVQAAETAPAAGEAAPPPEVTGWATGAVAPVAEPAAPPAWSTTSFPVAPVETPSDPANSMVGIAPSASPVREAAKRGHVFTNDDLVQTRAMEAPVPARETAPPPSFEPTSDRGGDIARRPAGGDPESRVAAAQRRVLAIRDRARATGQDLDDEMEDAIDAVREAQKEMIKGRRDSQ